MFQADSKNVWSKQLGDTIFTTRQPWTVIKRGKAMTVGHTLRGCPLFHVTLPGSTSPFLLYSPPTPATAARERAQAIPIFIICLPPPPCPVFSLSTNWTLWHSLSKALGVHWHIPSCSVSGPVQAAGPFCLECLSLSRLDSEPLLNL